MCGRMTILTYDEVLDAIQAVQSGPDNPYPDWPARNPKDAFPQSWVPVVVPVAETPKLWEAQTLCWGYPVDWRETPVFNTRIESILQGNGMWRDSAAHRRCLVPTFGFYERHGSEMVQGARPGRRVKRSYAFRLKRESLTWLAGIYEGDHFSVVTTAPNADVSPVHDRMPLVLRRDELELWLGEGYASLADRTDVQLQAIPEPIDSSVPAQLSLF